jgi:hypothetical protein
MGFFFVFSMILFMLAVTQLICMVSSVTQKYATPNQHPTPNNSIKYAFSEGIFLGRYIFCEYIFNHQNEYYCKIHIWDTPIAEEYI